MSPHVHVDIGGRGVMFRWRVVLRRVTVLSGAEVVCSDGGSSFAGVAVFFGAGEDARAVKVSWLVLRMSGRAGDASLFTWGSALELEACSRAIGALRERKEQVNNQKKKYVRNNIRRRKLPRGNRSLPLGLGHADFLSLGCMTWFRLGLNPTFPAGTSTGGGRSLIQRGSIDDFLIQDD
jgi:hypothetical protein